MECDLDKAFINPSQAVGEKRTIPESWRDAFHCPQAAQESLKAWPHWKAQGKAEVSRGSWRYLTQIFRTEGTEGEEEGNPYGQAERILNPNT